MGWLRDTRELWKGGVDRLGRRALSHPPHTWRTTHMVHHPLAAARCAPHCRPHPPAPCVRVRELRDRQGSISHSGKPGHLSGLPWCKLVDVKD